MILSYFLLNRNVRDLIKLCYFYNHPCLKQLVLLYGKMENFSKNIFLRNKIKLEEVLLVLEYIIIILFIYLGRVVYFNASMLPPRKFRQIVLF